MKRALSSYIWVFITSVIYILLAKLAYDKMQLIFPREEHPFLLPITVLIMGAIYMWIPGIFALIFARKDQVKIFRFLPLNRYYAYAILLPLLITILAVPVSWLFEKLVWPEMFKTQANIIEFVTRAIVGLIIAGLTINLLLTTGIELYFRGYFLEKIKNYSFYKASLIIGFWWGVWLLPYAILWGGNYPGYPLTGAFMTILFSLLVTPILLYLRLKGKSILVSALFLSFLNGFGGLVLFFFPEKNFLLIGVSGIAGFIVLAFFNLLIYFKRPSIEALEGK